MFEVVCPQKSAMFESTAECIQVVFLQIILRSIHTAQTNANKQVGPSWPLDLEFYEK